MRMPSTPRLMAYERARKARRRPPSAPPRWFGTAGGDAAGGAGGVAAGGAGGLLSTISPKLGTTKKSTPREPSFIVM